MASNFVPNPKEAAKKAGHYVPSRYKQAAEKISSQSSGSRERTLLHKSTKENPSFSLATTADTLLNVDSLSLKSSFDNTLKCTDKKATTSTPAGHANFSPQFDTSSINYSVCSSAGTKNKERTGNSKRNLVMGNKPYNDDFQHSSVMSSSIDKKKNYKFNQKIAEDEIDISYAYYLQAAFLESQAKKSLEMRINTALEKIHEVWHLIQIYRQEDKKIQKQLHCISYLIEKHKHIQKQEQMLKEILEILPALENEYETITRAVDTARHKLPVKDVLLPPSEEIIQLLEKVKGILNNLPTNMTDLDISICKLNNFAIDEELISEEIKSCIIQLSEARNLELSEASFMLGCEL